MAKMSTVLKSANDRFTSLSDAFAYVGIIDRSAKTLARIMPAVETYHSKRETRNDSLSNAKRHSKKDAKSINRRRGRFCTTADLREVYGTADLAILRDELASYADRKQITCHEAMSAVPFVSPGIGSRPDCTVLPFTKATKADSDDTQNMRQNEAVCTYSLLGIATVQAPCQTDDDDTVHAHRPVSTIHAMAHGKRDAKGEQMFAIVFKAEVEINGTRQVKWLNPSNIDASAVCEMVARLQKSCQVDPSRLRFFVDASVRHRCETVEVGGYKVRTAAATADLMMKESKFAPIDVESKLRAKRADVDDEPKLSGNCRDITAEYKAARGLI